MKVPLLFSENSPKKDNRKVSSGGMSREAYEDIEEIRARICDSVEISDDHELVRIIPIIDYPHAAFRVTILKRYKNSRSVRRKDGSTAILKPGLYVDRQYLAEKVSPLEYVFTPPLPYRSNRNVGNLEKN